MADEVRAAGLDKFYTRPEIVRQCLDAVMEQHDWNYWQLVIEPSAGNGRFLTEIPVGNKIGLDIAPEHPEVQEMDFFNYTPPAVDGPILVVGNPPFGKGSSLAVAFFNHAATWAHTIAFIIPRTFRRISVQKKISRQFHLEYDADIPTTPSAFEPSLNVKCCFQIWSRHNNLRVIADQPTTHQDWIFLAYGPNDGNNQPTPPVGAVFAMRAYGAKCGTITRVGLGQLRPKSWHWFIPNIDVDVLIARFAELDYSISKNTARQESIGRADLVALYTERFDE